MEPTDAAASDEAYSNQFGSLQKLRRFSVVNFADSVFHGPAADSFNLFETLDGYNW